MVSRSIVADILSVSKYTLERWEKNDKLVPLKNQGEEPVYSIEQLKDFSGFSKLLNSSWDEELKITPIREYKSMELFSGAGGLALGLEQAGYNHVLLNEIDADACDTLRLNRPDWSVVESDVSQLDFSAYAGEVDLVAGGFPCQAFSYAGKKLGFEDIRGTLFFEFARAVDEIKPKLFLAENVRGLMSHDQGRTLETMKNVFNSLGYTLVEPKVLRAIFYKVPQKRERLFLIGIRNDLANRVEYNWPSPYNRVLTLRDALYAGDLYDSDVPDSEGQEYPLRKKQIMENVPPGGYWRNLPIELQKEYMKKSFYLGGGKTGVARRLSLDEPSLTLTCAPAQKQTERCHPIETRPLRVREYARIQTFPDEWQFCGSLSSKYKQIGNAVPVNLGAAVGRSLIRLLNEIERLE